MPARRQQGQVAEALAIRFLKKRGVKIIAVNVSDRGGELDVIGRHGSNLCMVEVRSRGVGSPYPAQMSLGPQKVRRLSGTASRFVQKHRLQSLPVRFDLLVVDWENDELCFYPGGINPRPRQ